MAKTKDKRVADRTFISLDEGYNEDGRIGRLIEEVLDEAITDTYNNIYVVRVTVTELEG